VSPAPAAARALVLNAGSGTLKWTVFGGGETVAAQGTEKWAEGGAAARRQQVQDLLARIETPSVVGHRVVHGGATFRASIVIDSAVRAQLASLRDIDPLHVEAALIGIDAVTAHDPDAVQIAAFDTAFHATLSEAAAIYALPYEWTTGWGLRRYGFHGLSVAYSVRRSQTLLGYTPRRMIVCHLGNGCSVTAVADGRSIDTTMGFSPLEGMTMATRAGSVDPGLLLHLQEKCGIELEELTEVLNHRSGLLGLSGISSDLRKILAAAQAGVPRAVLARDHFIHDARRAVGAMLGVLGGVDAIVFTGGIGENQASIRAGIAAALAGLSLELDPDLNGPTEADIDVAASASPVRALVIHAREDLMVLADIRRLLGAQAGGKIA
jgi:acetate kinase